MTTSKLKKSNLWNIIIIIIIIIVIIITHL